MTRRSLDHDAPQARFVVRELALELVETHSSKGRDNFAW